MIGEAPYVTPAGFNDKPFIYAYDGDALTDATSPANLSLPIQQDADFIIRRVTGLETVADKILLRGDRQEQWSSAPVHFLYDYAVVPERQYASGSFIGFDLLTVLKAFNAGGGGATAPYPQIIFQGVKRYKGTAPVVEPSTYPYRLYGYTYELDVIVTWRRFVNPAAGGAVEIPRTFVIPVMNYDFELCQISVNRYDGVVCSTDLKLQLYNKDSSSLFNVPVLLQYLQDNNENNNYNGVFPCPPVLYPAGSQIKFDVTSLLTSATTTPITYAFCFKGMQRFPCAGGM